MSLGRREIIRRFAAAAAVGAVAPQAAHAAPQPRPYADPDLLDPVVPWSKVLTKEELTTLQSLCDLILPAEGRAPSTSQAGVPDFIDEWVSAPYPDMQKDQQTIRGGLSWLNTEAHRRGGQPFARLPRAQQTKLCDELCDVRAAKPAHRPGALMFERVRALTLIGYYTTEDGMKEIGYVGNVPMANWEGTPQEVLVHLKLDRK